MNCNLNGCKSRTVTELQRDKLSPKVTDEVYDARGAVALSPERGREKIKEKFTIYILQFCRIYCKIVFVK